MATKRMRRPRGRRRFKASAFRRIRGFGRGMMAMRSRYKKMPRRRRRAAKGIGMGTILLALAGAWYFLLGGSKKH